MSANIYDLETGLLSAIEGIPGWSYRCEVGGGVWALLVAGDSNDYDADSLRLTFHFAQEI